jgi:molybdopterin-containing oxidoreductase family membrane subunit
MTTATAERNTPTLTPGFLAWLGLLGVLLAIGAVGFFEVFSNGLVVTNLSDSIPWGLWITIDLSAIALGAGAFTLSAIVYLFRLKSFQPVVRLAVLVGVIGYTTALLTLVADIGRPDRFWHPWVYWNVHSVLWEITWCITLYLSIMMVEFAPVIVELSMFDRRPALRRFGHRIHKLAPVLAIAGLFISLLHQSSLGATYGVLKARPIWFKPSMPIMFIVSAIAVGPAVTMASAFIVEWVTRRRTIPHNILRTIARFSGFGLLIYAYIKLWDLAAVAYYGQTPAANNALYVLNKYTPYNFGLWFGEVFIGIAIPVLLFLVPQFNRNPLNLVLGSGMAAVGIVVNRWNVTVSGLVVPLDYSPGEIFQLEAGSYFPSLAEWSVAVGVIGYALMLFTLGVRLLPLFRRQEHSRII